MIIIRQPRAISRAFMLKFPLPILESSLAFDNHVNHYNATNNSSNCNNV